MDKNLILLLGILLLWMVAIRNDITITKKAENTQTGETDTVNNTTNTPQVQTLSNAEKLQQYAVGRSHAI